MSDVASETSGPDYWFYHLEGSTLEGVLPDLLEKSLSRGWRVLVKLPPDKQKQFDDHLWTFRDDSFIPHGRDDEPMADWQPVLLSSDIKVATGFDIVFLLDGAEVEISEGVSRVMVMINGRSEQDVSRERGRWKALKAINASLAYYQQNERGRWEKRA
ncbi:DNA polymerase III chi subunit [Litorimonas taeanensis]|uniref:DNA polymerase III chi subunit n=1 Tax=Litorimonas taeanensis TaxID=568099 RepID=A0A420WID4_9PROT|nr:DNA polymerase III subunit chi [Litorimonas taeanensis]RKQ70791.1 DNA polymerase III chi subunit [Litorimonas taeanensis]